jgi:putative transposase
MQRKGSTRLKNFDYTGTYFYFVTCSTYKKKPFFTDEPVIDFVLDKLNTMSTRYGFNTLAYCFMPDHFHLLTEGKEDSSLPGYMQRFKQVSSYGFKKEHGEPLWQRSYYDNVLRKEQSVTDVAKYILDNPVRKGIVKEYTEYPFSGSLILDVPK